MKLAELQELEARWVMQTYARMPVEFVRGEGARLWDSEGVRVPGLPRRDLGLLRRPLPPGRGRGGAGAGRHPHSHLQSLPDRGRRPARRASLRVEPRRPGVPLQLGDRGQRVRDQARPQARPRSRHLEARDRGARGRLPRPDDGLALGHARAATDDRFRPTSRDSPPSRATTSMRSGLRSATGRRRSCSSRSRGKPGSTSSPTR